MENAMRVDRGMVIAVVGPLMGALSFAQAPTPAREATAFFKKYDPTLQLHHAVTKGGLGGNGSGGGGGSPADRKHCEGHFLATPKQADELMRRLFTGMVATAEETGAKLDGAKELPKKERPTSFRVRYSQDGRSGEVAVALKRNEATASGAFRFTITIVIVEKTPPKKSAETR
jgi:hypothetical protein